MKISSNLYLSRKRSGLSQHEVADLLYIAPSTVSELESGSKTPTGAAVFASEIVFGASSRELFPTFCERVESRLMRRALKLFQSLEREEDEASKHKCRHLLTMIERVRPQSLSL